MLKAQVNEYREKGTSALSLFLGCEGFHGLLRYNKSQSTNGVKSVDTLDALISLAVEEKMTKFLNGQ